MIEAKTSEILDTVERISTDMLARFGTLSQEDWESPSRCHMWAVKDVASHMVATFGFFLNSVARSIAGDGLPPEGSPNPGTADARNMADGIASRAIQISETDLNNSQDLLKVLSDLESELLNTLKSLSEEQWHLPAYHPSNKVSNRGVLSWKLLETSLHSWDSLNALDTSYQVDQTAAELLKEVWTSSRLNRWFTTPNTALLDPVTLDVDFGSIEGLKIISWRGNLEIVESEGDQSDADAVISVDPGLFSLLITARTNMETAILDGRVSISGNRSATQWFHTWFRGT